MREKLERKSKIEQKKDLLGDPRIPHICKIEADRFLVFKGKGTRLKEQKKHRVGHGVGDLCG